MQMTLISFFNDIPPHESPLQVSSSPIPRIRIWSIKAILVLDLCAKRDPKFSLLPWVSFLRGKGTLTLLLYLTTLLDFPVEILFVTFFLVLRNC